MPLTPRKVQHMRDKIKLRNAGRDQEVILTLRNPDGTSADYSTRAVWRVAIDDDPARQSPTPDHFHTGPVFAVEAVFNQMDVTLQQLRATIFARLGADATNAQPGLRYTLLQLQPVGAVPGGDCFYTTWAKSA